MDIQLLRRRNHFRPAAGICIRDIVPRAIRDRVARRQNLLFGQKHEAVAARMRPSEVMELHPPLTIVDLAVCIGIHACEIPSRQQQR